LVFIVYDQEGQLLLKLPVLKIDSIRNTPDGKARRLKMIILKKA
jgi:hypothetical protein